MFDLLSNLNGWGLILFGAVVGGLAVGLVCTMAGILANYSYKIRRLDSLTQLKQAMLNRGMSAGEIEAVLEAGME